jgi:DNA-binding transcriptional LysR family regulator
VSRAIAFLEAHVGAELLHRTTRSLKLSEAGERYAAACRRVLVDLEEADIVAAGERSAPRGTLTLTAPVITGEDILRPVLDAFMNEYQTVSARLYLLDRPVNLIDEGIDVALRIAHLADSSFVAIRLGEVRRVVAASPRYLARHPVISEPADLAKHRIIAMTHFGLDSWSFPPLEGSSIPRAIQFAPRLVVNTVRAAVASATEGHGVTRLFSYHIAEEIREGRLQIPPQQARIPAAAGSPACPASGASRCPGAPLSTLPCPASSGTSRGSRTKPGNADAISIATRKSVCLIAAHSHHERPRLTLIFIGGNVAASSRRSRRHIMGAEQKVVIITGASQGIGADLVKAYRDRNYRVVANSRSIKPSSDPDIPRSRATLPIRRRRGASFAGLARAWPHRHARQQRGHFHREALRRL